VTSEAIDGRSDEALVAEIAEGKRGGLEELYRRHAGWLTLRLGRRCADPDVVDQVIQDVFLAVWRAPDSYRGQGEVGAWLWGIGIRRLVDQLRRRTVRERITLRVGLAGTRQTMRSAEEQVLAGVEFGDLAGAVNRLSPELRAVVQATVLDGLTTREAARLLDIPAGTVKTRMMRARIQLREELA
jgi:RNA polymerase sigma-70 factor, ECF subfamily